MRSNTVCGIGFLIWCLIFACDKSWAWDDQTTHRDLSSSAAQKSQIGPYLQGMGYPDGLERVFYLNNVPKKAWKWIEDGAEEEDAGNFLNGRYYNHFHDPTKAWDQAGLSTIYPGVNGKSSVLWAQDTANDWSWQKVREYYRLALTSPTETDRNTNFANTFKGLGHIIHLVQDTSQPAHVRNDPHGLEALGLVEGFESWAKSPDNRSTVLSLMSNPVPPTFSLNNASITQFFDTDQYTGSNPSNSTTLGLAEYTNANFFSEDTIFTFPYPAWSSVAEYDEIIDANTGEERTYLRKTGDGETVEHFATARWFYRYLPTEYRAWGLKLDDQCYNDYAQKLIPRAVGYSAGLLNYFFRGKIFMEKDPQNAGKYIIKNESTEPMSGAFALYYDDASGNRNAVPGASWTLSINPSSTSSPVTFTEPTSPAPKEKGKYILVFQGKLGAEEGAVVGREVILPLECKMVISGPERVTLRSSVGYSLKGAVGNVTWKTDNEGTRISGTNTGATLIIGPWGWPSLNSACSFVEPKGQITITATDQSCSKTLVVQAGTWVYIESNIWDVKYSGCLPTLGAIIGCVVDKGGLNRTTYSYLPTCCEELYPFDEYDRPLVLNLSRPPCARDFECVVFGQQCDSDNIIYQTHQVGVQQWKCP